LRDRLRLVDFPLWKFCSPMFPPSWFIRFDVFDSWLEEMRLREKPESRYVFDRVKELPEAIARHPRPVVES
jgi:hypothetical protein